MLSSDQIRQTFLDFFRQRDHRVVPSSSLVPAGDPTLLFTNAGMNQFKDVFLGREKRDYLRAASSQKCVRAGGKHNDLEQVGRTTRHHTFFEMLGNFSFGDYFKAQAIPWAWELITSPATGYGIPADKLYVTVFREDDEADEIWRSNVGVPKDRIFRMDEKDNFWAMGDTGPCGPCSEIHYDMGPEASDLGHADCKFPCDCGRYVELWNLVFMQFNRDESGAMTPLPRPSIDTGAGLERLAAVLQGKLSNFDTDLFRPLIDEAALLAKVEYGANHETDVSLRIIADHARASTFLISDGVLPSNEGSGYVLRKILRRALRHGRMSGIEGTFLYKIAGHVADRMQQAYPELLDAVRVVSAVIRHEEERYETTLSLALKHLNSEIKIAASQAVSKTGVNVDLWERADGTLQLRSGPPVAIPGNAAFQLYDTFGLSLDLLEDEGSWRGFSVDRTGFEAAMTQQRERARASWKGAEKKAASPDYLRLAEAHKTEFLGYTENETRDSRILALMVKGAPVNEAAPGTEVEIILDRTPFYAEAGGQIGDTGYFTEPGSPRHVAEVSNTYRPVTGITAHKAVARETVRVGDLVTARVDAERREQIKRNHTATHLLHAALRKVLGTHVKQAGSLVAPDHLRFDFTHYASVDRQDLT
ncbi:MAG TPA: alanine--tRNA ligase, partial [Terriglobia bacterium]